MAERTVRLKDDSIVVCLDTSKSAKYRYVRKGGSSSDIGGMKSGGGKGSMYVPGGNKEIWDTEIEFDEVDVERELRFQPGDYVKREDVPLKPGDYVKRGDSSIMVICGIPANCGPADYTMNQVEPWGGWSSSYTVNDPGLVKSSKEEAEAQVAERRAEWKAQKKTALP